MTIDLREQVRRVIDETLSAEWYGASVLDVDATTDAVLAVFAERERDLRARIEALPPATVDAFGTFTTGAPHWVGRAEALAVFDSEGPG